MVLSFNLVDFMMVEDNREVMFDAQKVVQERPKLRCKYWATIANNVVRQTVMSKYNIEYDFC